VLGRPLPAPDVRGRYPERERDRLGLRRPLRSVPLVPPWGHAPCQGPAAALAGDFGLSPSLDLASSGIASLSGRACGDSETCIDRVV
jgi:hypothetical protein